MCDYNAPLCDQIVPYTTDNNQLTDKLTNYAFNPYAQSNVQKSQCGFNNYSWQEYNGGPYYYNGDSVQEGNVCFDAILDSICVFDSDSDL